MTELLIAVEIAIYASAFALAAAAILIAARDDAAHRRSRR